MSEKEVATTDRTGTDHGFGRDVQHLGKYVGQLHDDLAGIAKSAGDAAQSGVAAVKEGAQNTSEAAKRRGELAVASLRDGISKHPGATLGIAVGVGVLIGLVGPALLRSRRRAS
jgi:ElaB/YqjD/DUF883 family membrane-anchored ribosome-binding protein